MSKDPNPQKQQQTKSQATQPNNQQFGYYPPPGAPYPGMELARAYIPIQRWGQVYPPAKALEYGTLFPELLRPYPY